jgi:hypothetical protein
LKDDSGLFTKKSHIFSKETQLIYDQDYNY